MTVERPTASPMQPAHLDEILSSVRADMASAEAVVAEARQRIAEAEMQLAELRRIEAYLTKDFGHERVRAVPSSKLGPSLAGAFHRITTDEVASRAEGFLRAQGAEKSQKALDIAQHIFPDYNPLTDGRNFENRIFSILKRRSDTFVKVARGRWTLAAFINNSQWGLATEPAENKPETAERPF